MAEVKISELNDSATLTGSEVLPIVQGGATVKATAQDIADLGGGANPTSGVIPINSGGVFVNSPISNNNNKLMGVKPSALGYDGGFLITDTKYALGWNDLNFNIPPSMHWGFAMDLGTYELFNSFGKGEANGFYAQYGNRATIGLTGSSSGVIGANTFNEMVVGSDLMDIQSGGVGTAVKYIKVVDENGNQYKIALYNI